MSKTKTAPRPRGRPPKNARPPMAPELREAIASQDHAEAEKENSVVLSIITSANQHQDYFSSEEDGDESYRESILTDSRASVNNSAISSCKPAASKGKTSASKSKPVKAPLKRLSKVAVDAAKLTQDNYEHFTRHLESKCNNKIGLLSEQILNLTRTTEKNSNSMVNILSKINTTLANQANNTQAALLKQEKKSTKPSSTVAREVETICLDSSPHQASSNSSSNWDFRTHGLPRLDSSVTIGLEPLSLSQHHAYVAPPLTNQADAPQWNHVPYSQAPPAQTYLNQQLPPPLPRPFHNYQLSQQPAPAKGDQLASSTPFIPDYNALMDVVSKNPSNTSLARESFKVIFGQEIRAEMFATGQYNMYGRTMRGSLDRKFPLDSAKVHALRTFVEDKLPTGCNKEDEWHKGVDAIHRYIQTLKRN